jgi:uncharacterized protein YkwD
MNLVDVGLVLVILFSLYSGYQKGFIRGAIDLALLAVSLVFAFASYPYVAAFLQKNIPTIGIWTLPLAFILSYFFIRIILSVLAGLLLRSMSRDTEENIVNKSLGLFPGAINGIISAAIFGALLLAVSLFDGLSAQARESAIINALTPSMEWAEQKFSPIFDKAVNHSLNKLTIEPGTHKSFKLPYSVTNAKVREDLEEKMLDLVNEERQKEGLPALKADPEMRVIARAHSRDMFARSYFSHYSPEGETVADRARKAGIPYLVAGENLALAQTLRIAHRGLMNSPGHRANILQKSFGRVGIGILDGGMYGIMVTQNFRN